MCPCNLSRSCVTHKIIGGTIYLLHNLLCTPPSSGMWDIYAPAPLWLWVPVKWEEENNSKNSSKTMLFHPFRTHWIYVIRVVVPQYCIYLTLFYLFWSKWQDYHIVCCTNMFNKQRLIVSIGCALDESAYGFTKLYFRTPGPVFIVPLQKLLSYWPCWVQKNSNGPHARTCLCSSVVGFP